MNVVIDQEETETSRVEARGAPPAGLQRFVPPLLPAAICVAALVAPAFVFHKEPVAFDNGLGPAFWPQAILALLAVFALAWTIRDLWAVGLAGRAPSLVPEREDGAYSWTKAIFGLFLIVCYGALLPVVGFSVATVAFISLWCLTGGIRNPLVIGGVALFGTAILLWVFMGLALMPLSRGRGAFNDFSIVLLQLLGIY